MLDYLNSIDTSVFLFLNGWHCPCLDWFFYFATNPLCWIPLYVVLVVLVIRTFRWRSIVVIIGVVLMITASDQLANLSKYSVKRLRPTYEPQLEQLVHTVRGYRGGQLGFYSAHASTNFAIALFLLLLLRKHYRWITPVLLIYAAIMAYSRLYLGVHYPGDIMAGMIIGILLGWIFGKITLFILCRVEHAARQRKR